MRGKEVYLAELRAGDSELFVQWQWDEAFMQGISEDVFHPFNIDDWEKMFSDTMSNEDFYFTIRRTMNDQLIGFISLTNVYFKNRHGAIGIGIPHAENRGKGYGTEAIELLLAFAFDHLGLHKVRLSVHEFNQKALNVYKTIGFVQEGVNRESVYKSGKWYDQIDFGLLQTEWRINENNKIRRFERDLG